MKKLILFALLTIGSFSAFNASAQMAAPKGPRPSPADTVKATTKNGVAIEIAYSQPAVKGRTIGKDIAPYGKVWRTGANEATTISFSKDVKVEGKALPAGKYSLYSIPGEKEWVIIINKTAMQSGTEYKEADDALRVTVKTDKSAETVERFKFSIETSGKVSFVWGDKKVSFVVK
ncbi:DUF2911 domain-containing protein [Mucilaginibacter polytrichastri]|uniref:DUF2911 domain-containing protein n=1 Tax=Mucilaginibacter polytrichastri TaxID=1302689 RepID=A0A1Q6A144_9SPHI|nr:DUF2911 domain-containing protein [Mucilaginibacter polytrichastri]OKS87735.1 hypothetical protein RG47T_3197 [Mucilaginibacter polytrichastri]SFT19907.1 Protein of unknown function [Mucilaginibacter polytrichastri]